jgi:hypothetical protein
MRKYKWFKRNRCPHSNLAGIYGDRANFTPHFSRLLCLDCGRYLDGPVWIADARRDEYLGRMQEVRENEGRGYA